MMEEEGRLTPFMVFYTEHRESVKANLDKVSGGAARPEDISKEVARMWRSLGMERTRDYCLLSNLYAESRAKHAAAGTATSGNGASGGTGGGTSIGGGVGTGGSGGGGGATKRRAKKKKDEGLPKLPVSSFMWFSRHHRAILRSENQELSFCEVGKTVGALWKAATPADKRPFEDLAAEVHVPCNRTPQSLMMYREFVRWICKLKRSYLKVKKISAVGYRQTSTP